MQKKINPYRATRVTFKWIGRGLFTLFIVSLLSFFVYLIWDQFSIHWLWQFPLALVGVIIFIAAFNAAVDWANRLDVKIRNAERHWDQK